MKTILLLAIAITCGSAPLVDPPAQAAPELPVPAELAGRGVVYYTLSGREAQVTFTSRAPLENIVGKSNQVVGYAIRGSDPNPAGLLGAKWVLPVRSLATGIPLRDQHMTGDEWLDEDQWPTISFELRSVEQAREVKTGAGFSTWDVDLVGTMSMHGIAHELRVADARISFLEESDRTRPIAPGDLLFIKCTYKVRLSAFGIKHRDVPGKVSDEIEIAQMLRLTTAPPEASPPADRDPPEENPS